MDEGGDGIHDGVLRLDAVGRMLLVLLADVLRELPHLLLQLVLALGDLLLRGVRPTLVALELLLSLKLLLVDQGVDGMHLIFLGLSQDPNQKTIYIYIYTSGKNQGD